MSEDTNDSETKTNPFGIVPISIEEEMSSSYLDYAMSVIVSRAIPDVRDGLKPVHRRILYSMHQMGLDPSKSYRKSARVVGDVIGRYHPHGDSAVYESMVRMAQPFSMREMLVDGQGNFGSIDGDRPAAMRYTECKLQKISSHLLQDIDKNCVLFQDNYDGSESEPVVLPAKYPNLLVNGAGGIAVGMATNIPPHNLGEVINAAKALLKDSTISDADLETLIPGPDFPTGGVIVGRTGIRSAQATGRGSVVMRGVASVEEVKNNKSAIVITEIPYQVNKSNLIEKIADLVRDKRVEGISDIRDVSDIMNTFSKPGLTARQLKDIDIKQDPYIKSMAISDENLTRLETNKDNKATKPMPPMICCNSAKLHANVWKLHQNTMHAPHRTSELVRIFRYEHLPEGFRNIPFP